MWNLKSWLGRHFSGILAKSGIVLVLLCAIFPVWWQNRQTYLQTRVLDREVRILKKQVEFYQDEIKALESNPVYVEYLLREKLHYGYKNEYTLRKNDHGGN